MSKLYVVELCGVSSTRVLDQGVNDNKEKDGDANRNRMKFPTAKIKYERLNFFSWMISTYTKYSIARRWQWLENYMGDIYLK